MARRTGALSGCLVALGLLLAPASPAAASPETLKRAVGNILFGPLDIVFSPVVGSQTVYRNVQDIEDTMWVRVVYLVPGVAWNTTLEMGSGIIRCMTGLIELLPGIGLLPFEADLDPLFAPPEKSDALVDLETPILHVKFGVNYVD
jgi:hypothetical protein